jgi:hypothetical protein
MITATSIKGEEVMTDFQFKALMAMVLDIMNRSVDLDDAKKAIAKLAGELYDDKNDEENR